MELDRGRPTSAREAMDPVTAGALVLVGRRGLIVLATQRGERTPHVCSIGGSAGSQGPAETCVELAAIRARLTSMLSPFVVLGGSS